MKKIIDGIKSMLNDPTGELSSKRVMAVILIGNGIVLGYLGGHFNESIGMIGSGTALLSVNGITKT